MVRTFAGRVFFCATLASLAVALATMEQPALAADEAGPVKKTLRRTGRRLPPYYAPVVTEKQRQQIYKIQEEYQPKIDALDAQLKAVKKERTEKIEAVLTPEQKQKIEAAEGKTTGEPAKPAEKPSSSPPVKQK